MLQIYHAPRTRGFRVIWLCEELQVPYEVVPVDMSPEYRASPEWRRLNPVGKVPVMKDGDLTMYESGAMVQSVLEKYGDGRLQPAPATPEHGLYLQWSWFAEATFARTLGEIVSHARAFPDAEVPAVVEEMKGRARLCAQALDEWLEGRTWLLGDDFSAADIMMGYTLRFYPRLVAEPLPSRVESYWTRLTERPAFRSAEAADDST